MNTDGCSNLPDKITAYGVQSRYADKKITVIKILRSLYKQRCGYSIGLREAKDAVDALYEGRGVIEFYPNDDDLFVTVVREFFITERDTHRVALHVG